MTGFGKAEALLGDGLLLTAEVNSVNRKQLEVRCNLPSECSAFEDKVRKTAANYISRGALQVRVSLQGKTADFQENPMLTVSVWNFLLLSVCVSVPMLDFLRVMLMSKNL